LRLIETTDRDRILDALAEPARRRVVELLRERPHRAGELTERVGTSAPTMSRHLRTLLETGIVADERPVEDARVRLFRLRREPFVALVAWADQMQALWKEQLGSYRRHVERKVKGAR